MSDVNGKRTTVFIENGGDNLELKHDEKCFRCNNTIERNGKPIARFGSIIIVNGVKTIGWAVVCKECHKEIYNVVNNKPHHCTKCELKAENERLKEENKKLAFMVERRRS